MDLPIIILFIFVILAQWTLIALLVLNKKTEPKASLTLTEPRSYGVLHRAYKKAQAILGQAELSSVKIHAEAELATKKISDQLTEETKKKLDEYLNTLTSDGKTQVNKFLEEFEKNTIDATNKSLEDYKKTQIKAIDDNIGVVVERAIELILAKKMPDDLQTDLIYEALEQAKQEKLIT